ncbi:Do family serine endopeptidase [Arsenicitalea aurantiaca]|uniref:Do family serine endopeptidase n=1 Tax=Arsenicitalea aurantiaca TaxID=1783274 RepID=A0A433XG32_9HYPH|nr:Do family serine endopeptidase [Arsenicitalea aurantiaca]RUT32974.1 Do family serine endopeptidase [Arsenicitalea aurantiaca]
MSIRLPVLIAGGVLVVVLGGIAAISAQQDAAPPPAPQAQVSVPAPVERVVPRSEGEMQLSFAPVVRMVAPAVVNVYATRIQQRARSPFENDPFFQRFFGGRSPFSESRPRESRSLGSGVIVDPSGLILTNSHVVSGATDIRIALSDRRELHVDLVLDDPQTDLAVLQVRELGDEQLPALDFANSDALEVGDLVLAIGNPFGVGQTVTSGIVSALARTGVEASDYEFFIQTDAAINPGNSGGALVDLEGRVVGINTAIYSSSGGSVGIGFAIPSSMAQVVADAAMAGGGIVRPWLGAMTQAVNADIANSIGMGAAYGAIVTAVAPEGPAERAGLRAGDVVLSIDGISIDDPSALNFRLATKPLGSTAEIGILRNGTTIAANLSVEAPPAPDEDEIAEIDGNTRFAGVRAQALGPALAQQKGLPYDARGMLVLDVVAGSPAAALGLRPDDVIVALNAVETADAETFRMLASQRPDRWQIVLRRNGRLVRSTVSG